LEAEPSGKVVEDPPLEVSDQGEKAVCRRRDRHAEDGGERQQPQIAPASDELVGIG
jgi:hypothetical protein